VKTLQFTLSIDSPYAHKQLYICFYVLSSNCSIGAHCNSISDQLSSSLAHSFLGFSVNQCHTQSHLSHYLYCWQPI